MTSEQAGAATKTVEDWRDRVLTDPDLILNDPDVMRALIAANDLQLGDNVVDMRGMAMERLETRLEGLEDVHRSVIAAAYANVSGTNQVHRALLILLEQKDFASFVRALEGEVAPILRIERLRLILESKAAGTPRASASSDLLTVAAPGFIDSYVGGDARTVTLRQTDATAALVFGDDAIGSEALLSLDLGPGHLPGLLAMGARDPRQFDAAQGTDLLMFFADVAERVLTRWLD